MVVGVVGVVGGNMARGHIMPYICRIIDSYVKLGPDDY